MRNSIAASVLGLFVCLVAVSVHGNEADDFFSGLFSPKKDGQYVHPNCKDDATNPTPCAGLGYGNAAGYTVTSVRVKESSTKPRGVTMNPLCKGFEKKYKSNITLNQYVVFILPANCAYHMDIKVSLGKDKNKNFLLTPGCSLTATTDGTTQNSDWSISASYSKAAKQQGYSGTPMDADGYKCNSLGSI